MFHFSRRTLWIIIYVTIALIFVLHRTGQQTPAPQAENEPRRQAWSLDDIEFHNQNGLWTVDLPGAAQVMVTLAQPLIPTETLPVDPAEALRTSRQGGDFLVTLSNPPRLDVLETSVDFLIQWLPDAQQRSVIVSGPLTEELLAQVRRLQGTLQGRGVVNQVASQPALTRLSSPPTGSERQLAFMLWIGVLQQRLSGYQPEVRWDHRQAVSEVLINQTLSPELFKPVTEEELKPVLDAYQASAAVRQRSAEQIHRYLVTTAIYELTPDFLLSQPRRLAKINLTAVNAQRERSLSEM